ncbi:cytochrome c [Pseudorhodoferax sp.]|uniref:cytochrome c n=1 Tax=Pseudorhodoferax sp. TaxID=1993553 RepID=UPI002DD65986|nr:cytochrome c [Pseudorhodoferax sp.]
MRPWLRRTLWGGLGLVVLAGAAVATASVLAERKMQRQLVLQVADVPLRDDAASVERGRYLFASRGCADCHGANGAGHTLIDDPNGMFVRGPNLTTGAHSAVQGYRSIDWVRAVRHGVKRDGRPALIMPSEDYNRFTDADLAALVAYVRQLPPVDSEPGQVRFPLPVRVLYGLGAIQDAYEKIDHALPPQQPVAEGVTAAHGAYVANMCMGCHGAGLSGGKIPGGPPDWPAASNLTSGEGSAMPRYASAEQFRHMLATGKRPDGSAVSPVMPFGSLQAMSQTDADALYLYLKALPPRPAGGR